MTEFKITIEAAALTEAINNLATAIGSAGRSAETAPAITSAPKKKTKAPASAPAPAESAAAPTPVNPAIPAIPAAPTAPAAGTFVPGAPQANPAAAVPTNAQPFALGAPGVPGTPGVPTAPAVPSAPVGYTLSQLSNAGAILVEQGKMNELMALLGRYGVAAITQLAPAQYPAIAAELIAMGATL